MAGVVVQGWAGKARPGSARSGKAGPGSARYGKAGKAEMVRPPSPGAGLPQSLQFAKNFVESEKPGPHSRPTDSLI